MKYAQRKFYVKACVKVANLEMKLKSLSIVLPAYNEAGNITPLLWEIRLILRHLGEYSLLETIFVDDGSTDTTRDEILSGREEFPALNIRLVCMEKNGCLTSAMNAGFRESRGDVVASLDTDLQNDPGDIPKLIEALEEADVAIGIRVNRKDTFVKRISS